MGETSYKLGTTQSVAYTGTAGAIANVVGASKVCIWCSTDAHIAVGSAPVATTSDKPVTAKLDYVIDIEPGQKVSAIQQSAGGTLYVTPLSK